MHGETVKTAQICRKMCQAYSYILVCFVLCVT